MARSLPVGGAILISVFLIAGIVTLLNSVDDSITKNYGFVRHFSILTTQVAREVTPSLLVRVKQDKRVRKAIASVPYLRTIKTVFGELPVPIYGIDQTDMEPLIKLTGNRLSEGRLPEPGQPEVVVSRLWANNMQRKLGDKFSSTDEKFPTITAPQKIVGILDGGSNIAFADADFTVAAFPDISVVRTAYLIVPQKPADLPAINRDVKEILKNPKAHGFTKSQVQYVKYYTHESMVEDVRRGLSYFFNFLAIADGLVIGAVALLSGFLANIYFESRLGEFGLLMAFGFQRGRLAWRLFIETSALVVVSWILGLALTWALLRLLDIYYMTPRGLILAHINTLAVLYTLPTPLLVGIASLGTVLLRLYKLDPIAIMEHR